MVVAKKKKKCPPEGAADWLLTYGDMTTLLLTFFVMMVGAGDVDIVELKLILAAFTGLGYQEGGNTLTIGKLAELGNTVMSLPSLEAGHALDNARKKAISEFQPEIKSKMVRVKQDERGLVISLMSDAFFRPASAEINIEQTHTILRKVADLLKSKELTGRTFRIEGHTDSTPTDPTGKWPTNWELSAARANNVLHYLVDFGVNEKQFQVAAFADNSPIDDRNTPEAKAYNRRVDIIILSDGHL